MAYRTISDIYEIPCKHCRKTLSVPRTELGAFYKKEKLCPSCGMSWDISRKAIEEYMVYLIREKKELMNAANFFLEATGMEMREAMTAVKDIKHRYNLKSDRRCFIATACYGDPDAEEVIVLRNFRDEILLNSFLGEVFVRMYYFMSPPFAWMISVSPFLQKTVRRTFFRPLLSIVTKSMNNSSKA